MLHKRLYITELLHTIVLDSESIKRDTKTPFPPAVLAILLLTSLLGCVQ